MNEEERINRQLTNRCLHCGEFLGSEMNRVEVRIKQLKHQIELLQHSLNDLELHWSHLEVGFCDAHCHYVHTGGKVFEKD